MSKRKDRNHVAALFDSIASRASRDGAAVRNGDTEEESDDAPGGSGRGHSDTPVCDSVLLSSPELSALVDTSHSPRRVLPMMKKFRYQLLHRWLTANHEPCRVADVGGGKGLLAYLLQQSGWQATVIDPVSQTLPAKYKDIAADRQIKLPETERVPRIDAPFSPEMVRDFDLLVAMHAHGCNIQLIDAAAEQGRQVVLLPCCVIDEPIIPPPGVHWLQCVVDYALTRGFTVEPFRLNFKGQNIGLFLR